MLLFNRYNHLSQFKEDTLTFLEKNEIENNLPIGILNHLKDDPTLMATIKRDQKLLLVLLQTHPLQIILSKPETISEEEVQEIALHLSNEVDDIPGFIGERDFTLQLARQVTSLRDCQFIVQMNQRLYKLQSVKKGADPIGKLSLLTKEMAPLVKDWILKFCEETGEEMNAEQAEASTTSMIEKGRLYGWELDGEIVSMANATRPTKNNIHINTVFTPRHHRKKGYATSCVSALTQLMLDQGYTTTSLYTDLDNPTSNKIYMDIGYEPLVDTVLVRRTKE